MDNYIVYIREDGVMFHYKNKMLHREAGPAIVTPEERNKYINSSDLDLYRKTFDIKELEFEETNKADPHKLLIMCSLKEFEVSKYFLNHQRLSEKEFNAFMLKKDLERKAVIKSEDNKRIKI